MPKKGYKQTEEHRIKNSLTKIGRIAWNKGLTGIYSKEVRRSMSESKKGKHYSPATEFKKGIIPANFKGRTNHSLGYIWVYSPNHPFCDTRKNVLEHRLVVEKQISRYLNPKEMVHHINGVKNDNRPENLMAFVNRRYHIRFERGFYVAPQYIIFDGRKILA